MRSRVLEVVPGGKAGFGLLDPASTGLQFTNFVPEARHLTNHLLLDGSGVTAGDFDGDGRVDVFLAAVGGGSALWRNEGNFRFRRATETLFGTNSALATLDATGCAAADLNGDGRPDLIVNSHGQGTYVFLSSGSGQLLPLAPLNPGRGGRTIAIADVDGDGWLDLYVSNSRARALIDAQNVKATFKVVRGRTEVATVEGRPTTAPDLTNRFSVNLRGGIEELGEPDALYLNRGGTAFVEVPWTEGAWLDEAGRPLAQPPFDWGLSAQFRDLNGDGRPELYVCNDLQSPDRLWFNESKPGAVRFRAAAPGTLRHTSRFSRGVDFADVNRDGIDDFVVVDQLSRDPLSRLTQWEDLAPSALEQADPQATPQYPVNTLQLGRPDGTFIEAAGFAGIQASEGSWTPAFLDVDLDGWEDLLISTGQGRAVRDLDLASELRRMRQTRRLTEADMSAFRRKYPRIETRMFAFQNTGGRFRECAREWGLDLRSVAQGLCLADLDEDGDPDVIVNHFNAAATVFQNLSPAPRLAVRLAGPPANRSGIGALIRVLPEGDESGPVQSQQMTAGGRYLGGDSPVRTFAAPGHGPWTIEIRWPDGTRSVATNCAANRLYEIDARSAGPAPSRAPDPTTATTWFEDLSDRLAQPDRGETFDEYIRQPLLPRRLVTEAGGLTWADLDRDGREELIAPGGYQGILRVFRVPPDLRLAPWTNTPTARPQPMALPWEGGILLGQSSYTEGTAHGPSLSMWPGPGAELAAGTNSLGSLALGDVDGDGVPEIFVGSRVVPGQWPREPVSAVVSFVTNTFVVRQVLTNAGLVTAAVFADLDLDGAVDLAVAAEWSAPRLFRNDSGRLAPWTRPLVFAGTNLPPSQFQGLWTSVNAGDFDGDGRPDLVLGNWGLNSYGQLFDRPWVAYHGDLDADGSHDVILGYRRPGAAPGAADSPGEFLPMLGLGELSASIPAIRERFRSHRDYATATLAEVLGPDSDRLRRASVRWLESVVLLNREEHWIVIPLPEAAQMAPVFGIAVADWDGDGREDLFLSQNCFGHSHGWTRDDAGRGLLLRGTGDGRFAAMDPALSGIRMVGEGRAATVADPDGDGRPDLFVVQHGEPIRVFRNRVAKPGIRVRLDGGAGNPLGAGAMARWVADGKAGAGRVWRFGSGGGGSDSLIQVLARPSSSDGVLEIAWPGGRRTRSHVPARVRGIRIRPDGETEEEKF